MGAETAIAWTDHTFNPWWGCVKVAPECSACYAEGFDKRYGGAHWGPTAPRRLFGEKHWREPLKWNAAAAKAGARRRVFCASMADVFEDRADLDSQRARLWALIRATPHLDWLLLTKRPERIAANLPALWGDGWPNVWIGTSVGHPDSIDRARALADVPAAVRFVSCEPLIAPVLFGVDVLLSLDWMIVGGESGPKARPMEIEWARALHTQATTAGIYFFMKQLGGRGDKRDRIEDFPEDLRIREWPRTGGDAADERSPR
jgi:protein gp37